MKKRTLTMLVSCLLSAGLMMTGCEDKADSSRAEVSSSDSVLSSDSDSSSKDKDSLTSSHSESAAAESKADEEPITEQDTEQSTEQDESEESSADEEKSVEKKDGILKYTYERPIEALLRSFITGSGEDLKESMSDAQIEYAVKKNGEDCFEKEAQKTKELLQEEYGENIKITYKIKKKKKLDDKELLKIADEIKDKYGAQVSVTSGYKLQAKLTIKGDDDDDVDTTTLKVAEIDGKWSLLEY